MIWLRIAVVALVVEGVTLVPGQTAAQHFDTTIVSGVTLAEFVDPMALSVDPQGLVYVVDASTSTLSRFTPHGEKVSVHGGSGSGEYEFDTPSDIDASAGLIWLVADAGNGRIKRFSSEYLHLASLPVDLSSFTVTQSAGRGGFREEEGDPLRHAGGRPIAVATNMSDETFAIDANSGVVIKWGSSRRIERVFGGPGELRGALVEPVSLAIDQDGRIYVADRGLNAVLVYDRFGTFVRRIADGLVDGIVSVTVVGDRLLIVAEDGVRVYGPNSDLLGTYALDLGEPLRDVSVADGAFMVLTERRLVRVPF
jgi:DNA-binding beta-propeller fold protein YncE